MIGLLVIIALLFGYALMISILHYRQDRYIDDLINDIVELNSDLINALTDRDDYKKQTIEQKDTIADLSRQINEATVKKTTKKITKKTTTKKETEKKTTTKKVNTKKKEGKK